MSSGVELSPEQEAAIEPLLSWALAARRGARPPPDARALRGLAGTGKTTAAAELARRLAAAGAAVAVVAPTGRAASLLQRRGVPATTLHAVAYRLLRDGPAGLEFKPTSRVLGDPDVVLCDEASMLTSAQLADLLRRVPRVVLVGDPGQLPPVQGESALARVPGAELLEVRRQALDSGIVRFAHAIRRGASVDEALREGAPEVAVGEPDEVPGVALCARHSERVLLNLALRQAAAQERGADPDALPPHPVAGDRIVALANVGETGWCNGTTAEVVRDLGLAAPDSWRLRGHASHQVGGLQLSTIPSARRLRALCDDGVEREIVAVERTLGSEAASDPHPAVPRSCLAWWGWALTVHKAQGSEWNDVLAFDRPFGSPEDRRRWRYTAATRARARLWWAS